MTLKLLLDLFKPRLGLIVITLAIVVAGCGRGLNPDAPYIVIPDNESSVVTSRLIFGHDAAQLPGGTAWLAARAIEKSFANSGANSASGAETAVNATATREALILDFTCTKDSFQSAARTLASHLANLPLDESWLEVLRLEQFAQLDSLRRDATWLANSAFWQSVYQSGQHALPAIGSDSSISQIRLEDVRAFLNKFVTKDNFELGLSGPIASTDASWFLDLLQELLPPRTPYEVLPSPPSSEGLGVRIVELPGLTESSLLIGFGAPHATPDSASLAITLSMILQTSPSMSLIGMDQSLRAERGLVDAIDAGTAWIETASPQAKLRINDPARRDYAVISMETSPINALFAAKIVIKELMDLDAAGIPAGDINRLQRQLAIADSSVSDPVERMHAQLARRWMGIDPGMIGQGPRGAELTSVRVRQLLRSAFDPANLWIVAVVPEGERLRAEILSGMTAYVYPDWVDRREIRRLDQEYLSYRPFWQADKIQVVKADSLFR